MRAIIATAVLVALASPAVADDSEVTTRTCVDKEIADRLAVKRKRRGNRDRLFIKQQRHEFSLLGGYYVSDLYSSTWVAGGAYTFHMTESTAVEMTAAVTHSNAELIRAIEDDRGTTIEEGYSRTTFVESLLVWSPIYGKLRLGGAIVRFDLHLDLGVGVVAAETTRGATGVAGIGMKLFLGKGVAFRIDARDHVFRQELLDQGFIVNDVAVTAGVSVFLPFRN